MCRAAVFPKVDARFRGRGLRQPPGLSALGCQGSVRDRLTPPGRVEGSRPREVYSIAALARYGAFGAISYAAFGGENHTTALTGEGNAIPLWWLAPPPCPVGSMSLDSRVAELPYESSSFATPASGGTITRTYCRAIYE